MKFPPQFCLAKWPTDAQPIGPDGTYLPQLSSLYFARPCNVCRIFFCFLLLLVTQEFYGCYTVQGLARRLWPGLLLCYLPDHFSLSLPAAFTQPGRSLLADPCKGVHLMVRSGFREYEVKKVAFCCLQQAGERNFSSIYSQNPERTIKCNSVY